VAVADLQHLARLHVAHVGGPDDVEGARFGCEDDGFAPPAHHHGPEASRVASRVYRVADAEEEGEGADQLRERVVDLAVQVAVP